MLGFLTDIFVAKKIELSEHFILNPHSFFEVIVHLKSCLKKHCVGSHFSPWEHIAHDWMAGFFISAMLIAPVAHTCLMLKTACTEYIHLVVLFTLKYSLVNYTWKLMKFLI